MTFHLRIFYGVFMRSAINSANNWMHIFKDISEGIDVGFFDVGGWLGYAGFWW